MQWNATQSRKDLMANRFRLYRDEICQKIEGFEKEAVFKIKQWDRPGGGGGETAILKGHILEKIGVNISEVYGSFEGDFANQVPGTEENKDFWATGISVVSHPMSPLIPAFHMNLRMLATSKAWFGGGADLTPTFFHLGNDVFHSALAAACERGGFSTHYPKYKKWCDDYFYLPHRKEPRGIGGLFFDYHNSGDWEKDLKFLDELYQAFISCYLAILEQRMNLSWTEEDKQKQLIKRGRYVEFNLLHDRGTKFGLMTNGNIDAILMSMPPSAAWK